MVCSTISVSGFCWRNALIMLSRLACDFSKETLFLVAASFMENSMNTRSGFCANTLSCKLATPQSECMPDLALL